MQPDVAERVNRLIDALRRETKRLDPLDDSALMFDPEEDLKPEGLTEE